MRKIPKATAPPADPETTAIQAFQNDAKSLAERVQAMPVKTDKHVKALEVFLRDSVKPKLADVEAFFEPRYRPIKTKLDRISKPWNALKKAIAAVEAAASEKIRAYYREESRKAMEVAQKAAPKGTPTEMLPALPPVQLSEGLILAKRWKAEVFDVPCFLRWVADRAEERQQYVEVNASGLDQWAKDTEDPKLAPPGVKFFDAGTIRRQG